MEKRKQFTFYGSFYEALEKLPAEQAQQGLWAIVTYGLTGTEPDMTLEPAAAAVFVMAKPVLDASRRKADAITESNKRRAKANKRVQCHSNVVPTTAHEGEIEKEVENEVENEVERENEIEKESYLYINPLSGEGDGFESFWNAYPVKLGKQQAWEVWQADPPDPGRVTYALEQWKRSRQWNRENGRFIPKPAKFLEEKHYLELPKDTPPMGASGHPGKAELEAIEQLLRG